MFPNHILVDRLLEPRAGQTTISKPSANDSANITGLTQPLLEYYSSRGVLKQIAAEGTPEEVFAKVREAVRSMALSALIFAGSCPLVW